MMGNMGCFFSYLEYTLHMWLLWPGLCWQTDFSFVTASLHVKVLTLNNMKRLGTG